MLQAQLVMLLAGVGIIVGSDNTWVTILHNRYSGTHVDDLGWITLIAGIVLVGAALLGLLLPKAPVARRLLQQLAVGAVGAALAVAVYGTDQLTGGRGVHLGWGMLEILVASAVSLIAVLALAVAPATESEWGRGESNSRRAD